MNPFQGFSHLSRTVFSACVLVAVLASGAGRATAQEVAEAKIVRDIDVQYVGAAVVSEERILSNMATKVGDPFTAAGLDEDVKNLYNSGDVENVKILSEPVGSDGVRVVVVVQTKSRLGAVQFEGNTAISSEKLTKEADLDLGVAVDDTQIQEGRAAVQEYYRKQGFPEVTVNYRLTAPSAEGYSTVVYSIDEGGKGVLREVEFIGNEKFSARELRKQMTQKPKSLLSFFTKSGRIDEDTLQDDVRAIEDFYQNHGYLNARVVDVRKVRVDEKNVDLVLTIEEGDQYTTNSVAVNGVEVLNLQEDILPFLKIQAGKMYSGQDLKDDIQLIRDQYGVRGYADATVTPQLTSGGPDQVNVVYDVYEGRKFTLGQINIEGNTKTKDKVIRRELAVLPGEEFDTVRIEASKNRLLNLNYFSEVDVIPVDTSYFDVKDLNIVVAEKPTGTVNFGAGFSSIDDLVGFVDVTQTNFDLGNWPTMTGAGQKFRMNLKYGTERRDFVMGVTEPWFLDQRLALGGEIFYRDLFFLSDYYDQSMYGGEVFLRKPIGEFVYARVGIRPQNVEISVEDDASEIIMQEQGDYLDIGASAEVAYDDRDNLFLTRTGRKVATGFEYSGFGGDVETYGFNAGGIQFFHLPFDTILSFSGNIDVVDSTGDDRVPIFQREFLGGSNDLRGFDYREVGPKDELGEPIGGGTAVYGTVEYTIPVIEKVRLAAFYDAGVVNADSWDFGFSDYNSNYGIGVRLFILGGAPIRLDYGIPIEADEFNDSSGRFNFTLGYQF